MVQTFDISNFAKIYEQFKVYNIKDLYAHQASMK